MKGGKNLCASSKRSPGFPLSFPPDDIPLLHFSEQVVTSPNHFLEATTRSTDITSVCAKFWHCIHNVSITHWSRLLMKLHVFVWLKREASGKNPGEIGKTEECKTSIFRAPAGRSILCNHLPSKGLSSRKSANPYPCHLTVSINLTSYHWPKESPNHQHNHRHHYYRCHILIPEISWANEQYGVLQS